MTQIFFLVLMIALIVVGSLLLLLIACGILICCLRTRRAKGAISSGPSFLRYKGPGLPSGTLDRTAIIRGDASSESSGGGLDNHGVSKLSCLFFFLSMTNSLL